MASVDYVQDACSKLSINSGFRFDLKPEQKDAVNCLLEGRDVFAVMPTGVCKSFISVPTVLNGNRTEEDF